MTSGTPVAPTTGAGTSEAALFSRDGDLCIPISEEHTLAVGRAASLFGLTETGLGDLPRILDRVWTGWDTIHQTEFVGGTTTLVRHHVTGEWACWYARAEDPIDDDTDEDDGIPAAYDFHDWDDLTGPARRTQLAQHTLLALTGPSPTALVDRALARVMTYTSEPSEETARLLDFFDPDAAFAPRGVLTVAAAVYAIVSSGHPDAGEVTMLTGLGGYRDMQTFIDRMISDQEARQLAFEANLAYMAAAHAGRLHDLHVTGADYQCWACTFVSSRVMGYDTDFDPDEYWDRTRDAPSESFADELDERVVSVMSNWVDEEGFSGQHGVSPQRMLDVVLGQPNLSFYETVSVLLSEWVCIFTETFAVEGAALADDSARPVTITGWVKNEANGFQFVSVGIDIHRLDAPAWEETDASKRLFALTHFLDRFLVAQDADELYSDFHDEVSALCEKDTAAFDLLMALFETHFTIETN
jgi:hypothetical protein